MADTSELRLEMLFRTMGSHAVRYVLAGSVAAMAYGVKLAPSDLDVVPALDSTNLERLASLLLELGAKPKHVPTWRRGLTLEECERWQPHPVNEPNLDHRFVTAYGELDVVPRRAGTFDELAGRAIECIAYGLPIMVAHPDDLIAQCQAWDRAADRSRLPELVTARLRFEREGMTGDIASRLS